MEEIPAPVGKGKEHGKRHRNGDALLRGLRALLDPPLEMAEISTFFRRLSKRKSDCKKLAKEVLRVPLAHQHDIEKKLAPFDVAKKFRDQLAQERDRLLDAVPKRNLLEGLRPDDLLPIPGMTKEESVRTVKVMRAIPASRNDASHESGYLAAKARRLGRELSSEESDVFIATYREGKKEADLKRFTGNAKREADLKPFYAMLRQKVANLLKILPKFRNLAVEVTSDVANILNLQHAKEPSEECDKQMLAFLNVLIEMLPTLEPIQSRVTALANQIKQPKNNPGRPRLRDAATNLSNHVGNEKAALILMQSGAVGSDERLTGEKVRDLVRKNRKAAGRKKIREKVFPKVRS